jgi:membrane-associated HD superfamily phosphohydrolase
MAVGAMATFILILALQGTVSSGIYISAVLLITGLVCTARLVVSDHTNKEIYTGLFIGIASMLLAKSFYHLF